MKKLLITLFVILIAYISFRVLAYKYADYILDKTIIPSTVAIDVVFVTSPKDFDVLPYSVKSVQKYLKQPINKLILISPITPEATQISKELGMELIDENKLLDGNQFRKWVTDNNLTYNHSRINWYYQQFLKLLYYKLSQTEYFFIIDSDVIMNRPFVMVDDRGIQTFYVSNNLGHEISKQSIAKLLGEDQYIPQFSYIADLMIFNKSIVSFMISKIEAKFHTEFYKAALLIEQGNTARFSEYEMYGVFANFSIDIAQSNKLSSYVPLTIPYSRKRKSLFKDQFSLKLKKHPYIAYHVNN